ncbi:hypothetical protein D5F01_LYC02218 [Larimichthys crocea]|uniref:Transposase element L1Md-A101/L1Md-A102/L1Md-A2 n=1 Tax=Larimichthys crocea TaxID=215358 RepID=A0A6G0J7W2_LARCR|nr:hypothetical protein D5F01_LYC02218 [Larimichthys crocea]
MAYNLRKYEFTAGAFVTGPKALSSSEPPPGCSTPQPDDQMDVADLKILTALKADIAMLLRSELKAALADGFQNIKSELQAVKTELANNTAAIHSDVETMKATVSHMEQGLSSCSDDVSLLLGKVGKLETEVLKVVKDILIDRSHRGLQPRSQDGKPRVIVAKVHYYQDCADILRRARESGPLRFNRTDISIFPDYPPSVVQARSAFGEVRRLLRGRDGVKYGLLYPARLQITYNGAEKQFQNPGEPMAYVKAKILPDSSKD